MYYGHQSPQSIPQAHPHQPSSHSAGPPPPAPAASTGYNPAGTTDPTGSAGYPNSQPELAPRKLFPLIEEGAAGFTEDLVPYADIRVDDLRLCHRAFLSGERIGKLAGRMEKGEQMPPLLLWRDIDGALHLVDGWHRRAADQHRGVDRAPCLIIGGDVATALCRALMRNRPRNGGLRDDANSRRALTVLATALKGSLTEPEAHSLGLKFHPHEPFSAQTLSLLPPIGIVGEIIWSRKGEESAARKGTKRRVPPSPVKSR